MNPENVKIHVSHLKKNFKKLEVLKDVSVDIREGEVVVVIGPSGSGKSTFLRCLNRLEESSGGEILVDGIDITDKKTDINRVRERVGQKYECTPESDARPCGFKEGKQGRGPRACTGHAPACRVE